MSRVLKKIAKSNLEKLVQQFESHIDQYKASDYNEATLRVDFLNKFFEKVLGWDVQNEQNLPPSYREVVTEDALKIDGRSKAPDYAFRQANSKRVFFVEAKKPKVNISTNSDSAYQIRRYGWNANLQVSLLSNFEYFAVYDCSIKPKSTESAKKARLKLIKYDEYTENFDYLWDNFSWESVSNGSLKVFEKNKTKKGADSVDNEFLKSLDTWRISLAESINSNNSFDEDELNHVVQILIDRFIFLRIAEDRDVEDYGRLKKCLSNKNSLEGLRTYFTSADNKYNSGLFRPDQVIDTAKVPNYVIQEIVHSLYYPDSPYEFSVLPVEILGKAYEQFLGKQIKVSDSNELTIEKKPEVRKAGGVYYTPDYIVDYIVEKTLGVVCKGKKPKDIEKIKVIDPASGSGSFLLKAFEYLLDWYKDYYTNNLAKVPKKKCAEILTPNGELTTKFKGKVLIDNIFGVDIDFNAVEVTKLSLLLKCLEGETKESLNSQMSLFRERVLPSLDNNIKSGNSLIDFDIYTMLPDISDDLKIKRKINAFNFKFAFPEIFKEGGFDVVLGNPPYGFHQIHLDYSKKYFKEKYKSSSGSYENYFLFYERSLSILKKDGLHGFITPVTWLTIPSAKSLRKVVLDNYYLKNIVWFDGLVFPDAQVNTLISIIGNNPNDRVVISLFPGNDFSSEPNDEYSIEQTKFLSSTRSIDIFVKTSDESILEKIKKDSVPLSSLAKPCSGYNPYENGKGEKPDGGPHTLETIQERPYHSEVQIDNNWKPELSGKDLRRFGYQFTGKQYIKYGPWLAAERKPTNFTGERILVQEITGGKHRRLICALCSEEIYYSRDVIPVKKVSETLDFHFLLGLLNSKLITWYHLKKNPKAKKQLFPKVLVGDLKRMPIKLPVLNIESDVLAFEELIQCIKKRVELSKVRNTDQELGEIHYLEERIDDYFFQLYGLDSSEKEQVMRYFD